MPAKLTKEQFLEKSRLIHGDLYDYSKVEYKGKDTKVCIICPEHGEFWQTPNNHWKGKGCYECSRKKMGNKKYDTTSFIEKSVEIHGSKYDYSNVVYKDILSKVPIICPEHGEFMQMPYLHINGSGCPKCARNKNGEEKRLTNEEFIERAREIHGDKYDYSKVEYTTAKNRVCIICPEHGEFWQTPDKHLMGCGCPKCVSPYSKNENEIYDFLHSNYPNLIIEAHNRTVLNGKELDIYIPELKIGIEYNGLYWHNSIIVNSKYHYDKMIECHKKGIKLIQIFEDEYVHNKELVLKKICHILGKCENKPKIMARKCEIHYVDTDKAKEFLTKNHIQGYSNSTKHFGAFYKGNLIAVMSFKLIDQQNLDWELTRFAADNDYICQGVGGKLFSYFVKHYLPHTVKSFADRRWTINEESNLYIKLGFEFDSYTKPDYRYYNPHKGCIRYHKFGFRKQILSKKYNLPLTLTETEMTTQLGYNKVWDCGLIKYIWKSPYITKAAR